MPKLNWTIGNCGIILSNLSITPILVFGEEVVLTKEENELLCRVQGDASMGRLMRRHWTPVCLIEEVSEPDGDP